MTEGHLEQHSERAVRRTLANYLVPSDEQQMVSAGNAMAHVRRALPELNWTDRRLIDVIAGAIIIADLDVVWDRRHGQPLYGRRRSGRMP